MIEGLHRLLAKGNLSVNCLARCPKVQPNSLFSRTKTNNYQARRAMRHNSHSLGLPWLSYLWHHTGTKRALGKLYRRSDDGRTRYRHVYHRVPLKMAWRSLINIHPTRQGGTMLKDGKGDIGPKKTAQNNLCSKEVGPNAGSGEPVSSTSGKAAKRDASAGRTGPSRRQVEHVSSGIYR